MALGFDYGSYLNKEQPQENQFLTGNPATQPNAQTSWMNPDTSDWGKYSGDISGGLNRPPQQNTPPANGTALGAISAGQVGQVNNWTQTPNQPAQSNQQVGQTPLGFDATKWNDPNKHDPKYDAGHMLAAGKSLEEIGNYIQSKYPGYKYLGGDRIQGDDGYIYDFAYGSKAGINAPMWEQAGGGQGNPQSFMGNGNNQQNSFMQMIMQMLMGGGSGFSGMPVPMPRPTTGLPNQQFNPSGGYIPPSGNTGFAGGYQGNGSGLQVQPMLPPDMGSYFNQKPGYSYIAPYGMPQ